MAGWKWKGSNISFDVYIFLQIKFYLEAIFSDAFDGISSIIKPYEHKVCQMQKNYTINFDNPLDRRHYRCMYTSSCCKHKCSTLKSIFSVSLSIRAQKISIKHANLSINELKCNVVFHDASRGAPFFLCIWSTFLTRYRNA